SSENKFGGLRGGKERAGGWVLEGQEGEEGGMFVGRVLGDGERGKRERYGSVEGRNEIMGVGIFGEGDVLGLEEEGLVIVLMELG
ncbi:hypothetical protein, partial [Neisseria sicca]|uniref:hypothetical protein n=1 Tax=Neisseria sicca TaxID=490 RepID=UPI001C990272